MSDDKSAAVLERVKGQCDIFTAEQFVNACKTIVILMAYTERRFQERFPAEFAAYDKEMDQ